MFVIVESGRTALMDSDGIRVLYTTCQETIECRELESLIYAASVIMRKCFPKNRLPMTSLRSTLTCTLPDSDFHVIDRGEGHGMYHVLFLMTHYLLVYFCQLLRTK